MGFREAFGVLGGGIAPFASGLSQTPICFYHSRHEAGAGFAAIEFYMATQRPGCVVVTTGPGLFNVLNAAMAARVEGAKFLVISGFTSRKQTGRGAVQETSLNSMPSELLRPGSIFHDVALPEFAEELPQILHRFARGFASKKGFVAHLAQNSISQFMQLLPLGARFRSDFIGQRRRGMRNGDRRSRWPGPAWISCFEYEREQQCTAR